MKPYLGILFLFYSLLAQSQYYYNDILGTQALQERMKVYTSTGVKTVTATGYDKQGIKTTDFNEWQEVNTDRKLWKITTRNGQQVTRQYYQFDDDSRLARITDSSGSISSVSTYTYDASNRLVSIKRTTGDADSLGEFNETEEHAWKYNAAGKPETMWRIVNGRDSSEYRFTLDEDGNIADEQLYRRGTAIDPVYYYYDGDNRLTDIVRYNNRVKKLLADFMFEYDDNNRVIQKITTLSVLNPDYLIWRFLYNDQGLKTKEALFDKHKELTGRIDYLYTFGK